MTVQIDYPLGLTGLHVTATAYAQANGDATGVALTFTENTTRKGYYSVTATVGGSGNLVAGLNWMQINVAGSNFDAQFVTITDGVTVVLVPTLFEASGFTLSAGNIASIATGVAADLGAATIALVSPLSSDGGTLRLTTGDSYTAANGQNFKFNIAGQTGLVGTVPHLRLSGVSSDFATAPAIVSATQQIVFGDVAASSTANLIVGTYPYQIRFMNGSNVATVIQGYASVKEGI